jgi:hypothetical protein
MSLIPPFEDYFPITTVSRADLEAVGFDASSVDDGTMLELADKMADAYLDNVFWIDLDIIAEALGIPQRADKPRRV